MNEYREVRNQLFDNGISYLDDPDPYEDKPGYDGTDPKFPDRRWMRRSIYPTYPVESHTAMIHTTTYPQYSFPFWERSSFPSIISSEEYDRDRYKQYLSYQRSLISKFNEDDAFIDIEINEVDTQQEISFEELDLPEEIINAVIILGQRYTKSDDAFFSWFKEIEEKNHSINGKTFNPVKYQAFNKIQTWKMQNFRTPENVLSEDEELIEVFDDLTIRRENRDDDDDILNLLELIEREFDFRQDIFAEAMNAELILFEDEIMHDDPLEGDWFDII